MVRFIIFNLIIYCFKLHQIYIPIWLDLLFSSLKSSNLNFSHLHSNMVRFIIGVLNMEGEAQEVFTFQYG